MVDSLVNLINLRFIHKFTEDQRSIIYQIMSFDKPIIYRNLKLALTKKYYTMIHDIIFNYRSHIESMLTFNTMGRYLEDTDDFIKNSIFDKTCINSVFHYGTFDDINNVCKKSFNTKQFTIDLPFEKIDLNLYEILINDQISESIDIVYPFIHLMLDIDFMIESYNIQTSIYRYLKKLACADFIDNCNINKYFLFLETIFDNSDLSSYSIFHMIDMIPIRLNNSHTFNFWRYLSPKMDKCNKFDLFCRLDDENCEFTAHFFKNVEWNTFIHDYLESKLDVDIEQYILKIIHTFNSRYNFTIYDIILYFMGNILLEHMFYEENGYDTYMIIDENYESDMSDYSEEFESDILSDYFEEFEEESESEILSDIRYLYEFEQLEESESDILSDIRYLYGYDEIDIDSDYYGTFEPLNHDYGYTFNTFITNYTDNLDRELYIDDYYIREESIKYEYPYLSYNKVKSEFLLHNPDKAHLVSYTLYMRYLNYYVYKNMN